LFPAAAEFVAGFLLISGGVAILSVVFAFVYQISVFVLLDKRVVFFFFFLLFFDFLSVAFNVIVGVVATLIAIYFPFLLAHF
jgi:hypothetical protein